MKTCVTCGQELPVDKLEVAGRRAAREAERLWELDIIDPPVGSKDPLAAQSLAVITDIIRENGWTWALPYRGNGPPQWCGMFAGSCWVEAGLDASWLSTYFASAHRLRCWGTYQKFNQKSKANPRPRGLLVSERLHIDLRTGLTHGEPHAGDILIVGDGNPDVGDHVTVVISYANGVFDTISGNGGGLGPKGDNREGISRRSYVTQDKGYRPMYLIRPALSDLL